MGNKKSKIFNKIFWPVVLVVILFVLITISFNYFSIDRFVKENAKEKVEEAYDDIQQQINTFMESGDGDFKLLPSKNLINQSNNSKVYVFDNSFKEVALFDNSIYIDDEMTSFLSSLLSNYELEEGVFTTIFFNDREYLANVYEVNKNLKMQEKYFVIVQDMTDKTVLLKENLRFILLIQSILLVIIVLTIYFVARALSKPVIKLSKESDEYVIGKGVTIDKESIPVYELEKLRETLFSMQEKIDEENSRKSTIYENVAHDLRTPLVSILGYADGLKSGIIKDKNKACDIILRTGNQLKEMIENILLLSRFDNDTYKSSEEEINLYDLINEQIEVVKIIDDDKKIVFDYTLDRDYVLVSDRKLLVRIIQNLLSNAIKYAEKQVVITVKEYLNSSCEIAVKDDGEGIEEKDIDNIFNRYYKGKDGHFGIGLAVVKSSVDFLGGDIKVASENGTTFIVTI